MARGLLAGTGFREPGTRLSARAEVLLRPASRRSTTW
jgi:hypothetical protein